MDDNSTEQMIATVLTHFKEEKFSTIVLAGESGIGKTWMARRVSLFAAKKGLVDVSLWVFLSLSFSQLDPYEDIARQLSLLYTSADWENDGNEKAQNVVRNEESLDALKEKIHERLSGTRVLLVLDDEGNKMSEGDGQILELLRFIQNSLAKPSLDAVGNNSNPKMKVLITSLNKGNRHHDIENTKKVINVRPLTSEMSVSLLQQRAEILSIPDVVQKFVNEKKGLTPIEVGLLAKLLSCHKDNSRGQHLERALEEASLSDNFNFAHLIGSGYGKVPDSVLLDLSWQGTHYFRDHTSIHYNELICYWIIEGYLGPVDCIEKAYEEGHRILMELMDCGMLKQVNDNYLIMKRVNLHLNDRHRCGIGGTARLGLANAFVDGYKGSGFGSGSKGWQPLLLGGNSLREEDLNDLSQISQELQVLGVFSHRFVKLPQSLPKLKKLNVLVLRGCEFLESIDDIKLLNMLTVLEVSNSWSIKYLPRDFFEQLKQLRSLNLSALQIEELPDSFYYLTDLRWLILKDCSQLRQLKSLRKCENLMLLNLSGAASLTNFPAKNLKSLPKLQMLDLSRTNIKSLPILHGTGQLTHVVLSGCWNMNRVPSLRTLTNLQVLDLSYSAIKEFHDKSLQSNCSLEILDLSGTDITSNLLPSNFSNPCQLYMKSCSKVTNITCAESPKGLEILDLSGACSLVEINGEFFEHLENLQVLNLTKAKLKVLPPLSVLYNLRELLLSGCLYLVNLPSLTSMRKLEVLDLSDCKALIKLEDESFEHLSYLRWLSFSNTQIERVPELKSLSTLEELNLHGVNSFANADFVANMHNLLTLDLSETSLEQLPVLSNLKNLRILRLSSCRLLRSIPSLEELQKLEILDLSHTKVSTLPSLERLYNLRELLLDGCSDLEHFANMRMVGLFGDIENLPCGISRLQNLVHLSLPYKENTGAVDNTNCKEKVKEYNWSISSLFDDSNWSFKSLSGSDFSELLRSDASLKSNMLEHFYFSVHPIEQQNGSGGLYIFKDEFVFRDIYLLSRHFVDRGKRQLVEIHDFDSFPKGIEDVLTNSEYVFLFSNSFINSFVDLGADNIKKMKGCWVEGCQKMKYVVDVNDTEAGAVLEILWISNALSLESLWGKSQQSIGFQNLSCLYLDSCPLLSGVLFPSYLPEKLAILHIRFCEKLETLFRHDLEAHILQTLRLWELPKLKSIECVMPSLEVLEVGGCPLFEHVLFSSHVPQNLQILKIRNCQQMVTLFEGVTSRNYALSNIQKVLQNLQTLHLWELPKLKSIGCIMPSLEVLEVGECPLIEHVLLSSHVPQNLQILKIRNCQQMVTLFDGVTSRNHALSDIQKVLQNLQTLRLWELPKLKSVGCIMPSLEVLEVGECPLIEHVLLSSHVPQNLQVLKIRNCQQMVTLFEGITSRNHALSNIQTVQLWGLPRLASIGITLPTLQNSIIRECPMLNTPAP